MIVNPHYERQTQEGLYRHYKAIAEAVDIPVIPYNNVVASGNDLKPETLAKLVKEGKVSYVKECVDSRRMQLHMQKCGDKISVFTGVDDLLFQCFTLGGTGAVSGGSNCVPEVVTNLYNLIVKENDIKAARELWYKYVPLADLVERPKVWIPNIKACCEIVGDPVGSPRRPLLPASEETKRKIRKILENLGVV